ncbi:glyoxalase/bleomycin resistance/extradiol dioxygenase family protein [bacterium (Candidatus Blackallbacteria) CG17_big_fil_post_rev_8_21_14_2_50_48_46]|uniref:Glyoxalase/bleomycin resistance/extradiol dioxygenase family protein n=1 Tax=bacterium (Candidatus Blackallbacteria) CG17_big_fil_post_rev_8_21_14_2_50_48_46 TaxID=2014261 RepID=A0A2M7G6U8_9BACT|nr:MAG: glyoxalase/bleomycin resistance/extradiol dioxygenase family protein [bacterium (Candidatus Blackallbacteria) CG18_big_fil_WC_8_21_14_2_50_49_26]PIW17702.1 MAG: glyoxalase/bleomycin resistance/extradiol dioxygenase family protein [bacterium (Candidatus Blackallbacteria) CG17_big_fil_post_rev_8_21_14_2_50_48_46]PIW47518.1 MAG: glyoxalase/bleomycin resistance/extradiol dioxygenase family protein [bacterium (Candidatus Blackallbacteria) CG13_big_fil_rev_8_21_14_2_50_49_14]
MFQGLRSLIFQVPDLQAASQWYQEILSQTPYFDQPFYIGFNVGGYELGLLPESPDRPPQRGDSVSCYWGVADIQAAYARLIALGAQPERKIENVGGEIELASLRDPWGNLFGIIYNPHFSLPTEN